MCGHETGKEVQGSRDLLSEHGAAMLHVDSASTQWVYSAETAPAIMRKLLFAAHKTLWIEHTAKAMRDDLLRVKKYLLPRKKWRDVTN